MTIPDLNAFEFSAAEKEAVTFALAQTTHSPWNVKKLVCAPEVKESLNQLKKRIKTFHLAVQKNFCCYCRVIMDGDSTFIADREHILPKRKFKQYSYEIWNLSVSCKRCNMSFKKEKTNFIKEIDTIAQDPQNPDRYKFVHPNFDCWDTHLNRFALQSSGKKLVFYITKPGKGEYTKRFFKLKELECNTFDEAQGKTILSFAEKEFLNVLQAV